MALEGRGSISSPLLYSPQTSSVVVSCLKATTRDNNRYTSLIEPMISHQGLSLTVLVAGLVSWITASHSSSVTIRPLSPTMTTGSLLHTPPLDNLAPAVPIFTAERVTPQPIRTGLVPFNAALVGFVEATRDDLAEKNRLCPPNRLPDVPLDWVRGTLIGFLPGLLTGSGAQFSGRFMVVARSPLTGAWGEANCGGDFGPALRGAGYDGLFVAGKADHPLYLLVDENTAELRDASGLWGRDARETEASLRRTVDFVRRARPEVMVELGLDDADLQAIVVLEVSLKIFAVDHGALDQLSPKENAVRFSSPTAGRTRGSIRPANLKCSVPWRLFTDCSAPGISQRKNCRPMVN